MYLLVVPCTLYYDFKVQVDDERVMAKELLKLCTHCTPSSLIDALKVIHFVVCALLYENIHT